jgi:hypothetical protein
MALKPYNTRTKIIRTAEAEGHVVLVEGGVISIDTGEELIKITPENIKNRAGDEITTDEAMDIVLAKPQE